MSMQITKCIKLTNVNFSISWCTSKTILDSTIREELEALKKWPKCLLQKWIWWNYILKNRSTSKVGFLTLQYRLKHDNGTKNKGKDKIDVSTRLPIFFVLHKSYSTIIISVYVIPLYTHLFQSIYWTIQFFKMLSQTIPIKDTRSQ